MLPMVKHQHLTKKFESMVQTELKINYNGRLHLEQEYSMVAVPFN